MHTTDATLRAPLRDRAQREALDARDPAESQVEIVVPVRNEERGLEPGVRRLRAFLDSSFPFAARITIADNGSTDGTWAQALALAAEFPLICVAHMERPGRGGALRTIWTGSDADIYAYMDVDLSTDLNALSRNGYANEFYAAAVQAGTKSWKAFLFGSVDSSSFITVDKTPASLWVMELSGRLFGFSSWSLLVPQALEGVATVGVLYATIRRWFSPAAAIIAGAVAALTPVAVLMFRFDNPDALLVLVLTLAAYTITRAIESGLTRWIVLTGAVLGLGYLTKMLQAFLVLPVFALAYLWAGQPSLGKRLRQLLAGLASLVTAAGWWVAIDLLTPAADRPYVGGSTDNNILQLTFGYNGLGRLSGSENSAGAGVVPLRAGLAGPRPGWVRARPRPAGLPLVAEAPEGAIPCSAGRPG